MKKEEILELLKKNYESFSEYNYNKKKFFLENLSPKIKKMVEMLPSLLCFNDQRLPGYIKDAPTGLINYIPEADILKDLKLNFGFSFSPSQEQDSSNIFIEMFALIGSAGTIAFSSKSDMDFWICYDPDKFWEKDVEVFEKKVKLIESYIEKNYNQEVHFFVNDIRKLQINLYGIDETEGFGGSLGILLKDEFFRSSIVLSGKIPFWWLVPANKEKDYSYFLKLAKGTHFEKLCLDIGSINDVTLKDFISVTFFQILKSLNSPFKSLLKIGSLEKAIFEKKNTISLLSSQFKEAIHYGSVMIEDIDSYTFLFDTVYQFYFNMLSENREDISTEILDVLKKAFYLKTEPELSKYFNLDRSELPLKQRQLFKYTELWGWTHNDIVELDKYKTWDYIKIKNLWMKLRSAVLRSYKRIIHLFRDIDLSEYFEKEDLIILSRKIESYFKQSEKKIDRYLVFADFNYEQILYIEESTNDDTWILFKKDFIKKKIIVLKKHKNLLFILTWLVTNKLFYPDITQVIFKPIRKIDISIINTVLNEIYNFFIKDYSEIKKKYLLKEETLLKVLVFIDFYDKKKNTINDFSLIYLSSWGETFCETRFYSYNLVYILTKIGKGFLNNNRKISKYFKSFVINKPNPIGYSLDTIIKNYVSFLEYSKSNNPAFYITYYNSYIYLFWINGSILHVESYRSITEMFFDINLQSIDQQVYFYPCENINEVALINTIIKDKRKNSYIHVYIYNSKVTSFVFIVDDKGHIFLDNISNVIYSKYLYSLYRFFKNILFYSFGIEANDISKRHIRFYNIIKKNSNFYDIHEKTDSFYDELSRSSVIIPELKLTVNNNVYTIILPNNKIISNITMDKFLTIKETLSKIGSLSQFFITNIHIKNTSESITRYLFEKTKIERILKN